jgi:FdrA protein
MIDNDLRIRMISQEAADPEVAILMLDVVLGEGAHPDPGGELSPPIAEAVKQGVEVVVILVGTDDDPQDLESQRTQLLESGAHVYQDALSASEFVKQMLSPSPVADFIPISVEEMSAPVAAINIGLESFYESLIDQGANSIHVDWRPPAGGNEKLMSILKKMRN